MKILEITKTIVLLKQPRPATFVKGQLYLMSDYQTTLLYATCLNCGVSQIDFSKYHEIDNFLKGPANKTKTIILHRTGGIGDIIALSSICKYLSENKYNVLFYTITEKYKSVFEWFDCNIDVKNYEDILPFKNNLNFNLNRSKFGLLEYENIVEKNLKQNWFEIFFNYLNNIDFMIWGRPHLKIPKREHIQRVHNGILFTLKATANIRSIDFKPVYLALEPLLKGVDIDLYIHENNLSDKDLEYIKTLKDNRIKILEKCDLSQFLWDCSDAGLLISTDTGSLHFREGVEKSALGIYNAFTSDCRTKYYQFVRTIDIKSNCQYQPCFIHTQWPNDPCKSVDYCMDMTKNKTLVEQLRNFFKENMF